MSGVDVTAQTPEEADEMCRGPDGFPDTEQTTLRLLRSGGCPQKTLAIAEKNVRERLYAVFTTDYRFGRDNHARTFARHFHPLVNLLGLRSLPSAPSRDTLESFAFFLRENGSTRSNKFRLLYYTQVFATAQAHPAYADVLRGVLTLDDAVDVDDVWTRVRARCARVECVSVTGKKYATYEEPYGGARISKATLRPHASNVCRLLDVRALHGASSADMTMEQAVDFCTYKTTYLVGVRILLLEVTGCPHAQHLATMRKGRAAQVARFTLFHKDVIRNIFQYRVRYYDSLLALFSVDQLDGVATPDLGVALLRERMTASPYPSYHFRIIEGLMTVMDRASDARALKKSLGWKYTRMSDAMKWRARGGWHLELIERVISNQENRVKQKSTYVEDRLKSLEKDSVRMLLFLDEHARRAPLPSAAHPLRLFLETCTKEMVYDAILAYGLSARSSNTRVKSRHSSHHAKHHVSSMITLFKKGLGNALPCHADIASLVPNTFTDKIENQRIQFDPEKRRVYTDEEVELLLDSAADHPQDSLMITLLREVGLRAGAICNLKYGSIVDANRHPKHICRVLEKGRKIREFVTGPNLKRKIVTYIRWVETHHKTPDLTRLYVFSRDRTPYDPLRHTTLLSILRRHARNAHITEVTVHPHVFRHTIVGRLMDAGNNLEVVAKFMGHASVQTTAQHYWLTNIEDLCKTMKNPFISSFASDEERAAADEEELEYVREKLDIAMELLRLCTGAITSYVETHPEGMAICDAIRESSPDIDDLVDRLQSVGGSLTTTATATVTASV